MIDGTEVAACSRLQLQANFTSTFEVDGILRVFGTGQAQQFGSSYINHDLTIGTDAFIEFDGGNIGWTDANISQSGTGGDVYLINQAAMSYGSSRSCDLGADLQIGKAPAVDGGAESNAQVTWYGGNIKLVGHAVIENWSKGTVDLASSWVAAWGNDITLDVDAAGSNGFFNAGSVLMTDSDKAKTFDCNVAFFNEDGGQLTVSTGPDRNGQPVVKEIRFNGADTWSGSNTGYSFVQMAGTKVAKTSLGSDAILYASNGLLFQGGKVGTNGSGMTPDQDFGSVTLDGAVKMVGNTTWLLSPGNGVYFDWAVSGDLIIGGNANDAVRIETYQDSTSIVGGDLVTVGTRFGGIDIDNLTLWVHFDNGPPQTPGWRNNIIVQDQFMPDPVFAGITLEVDNPGDYTVSINTEFRALALVTS